MIGNDIIDLSFAKKESNWQRRGFLEKQFTKNEQQLILASNNPFVLVWKLWSMKEAAYKIYTQQNEKRFFCPIKFECTLLSEMEGLVVFQNQFFYTSSIVTESYVFTIASLDNETKAFSKLVAPKGIDKMIKNKLEDVTRLPSFEIEQKKSKNGAPNYYHNNLLLTRSCSISHHGNYGLFSLLYAQV